MLYIYFKHSQETCRSCLLRIVGNHIELIINRYFLNTAILLTIPTVMSNKVYTITSNYSTTNFSFYHIIHELMISITTSF